MFWALVLACSCQTDPSQDLEPAAPRPARLVVPHDPQALEPFPRCVAYRDTVCEVCGPSTEACQSIRKVTDICAQAGNCQEQACEEGAARLRADPLGAKSESCTE